MTNAQKFQETFGIYATEMWAMPEHDFLKWLNDDTSQTEETCERCVYVRGSQWGQGCIGTPKRWDGEKIVDTPQTETQIETQNSNLTFEKRTMRDWYNCKKYETEGECIECKFEPKDEPQTDCAWK